MKFIDTATIEVYGGNGGDGCSSFRREKFVPRGGPDGGNGGSGGNLIFRGNKGKTTLLDLKYQKIFRAGRGEHGKGQNKNGKTGADLVIDVPLGTLVVDCATGFKVVEVLEPTSYIVARGGNGGRGNRVFASSRNKAPRRFERGHEGEYLKVELELKLLADVGIIGLPNAGKSTFISTVSASKAKVADYPFTTLTPNLGVVKDGYSEPYVLADMPGLIEGAGSGHGLGIQFLRHIERTKMLLHFVDVSNPDQDPIYSYDSIRKELASYSDKVSELPEVIVATKTESAIEGSIEKLQKYSTELGKSFFDISSLAGTNISQLLEMVSRSVREIRQSESEEVHDEWQL